MGELINTKIKKWQYINFENRSLTIPRNLMKVKNKNLPDFKVPLSDEVVNILKNQYQYTLHQEYVFLSVNNKVLNSNTTNVAFQRMRYKNKQILQGFRGIYNRRAEFFEQMKPLVEWWSNYIKGLLNG